LRAAGLRVALFFRGVLFFRDATFFRGFARRVDFFADFREAFFRAGMEPSMFKSIPKQPDETPIMQDRVEGDKRRPPLRAPNPRQNIKIMV